MTFYAAGEASDMRTIHTAARAVSILFSDEAPPGRGEVRALVLRSLTEAGLPPWEDVETDCFRAGENALVLARPGDGRRYFFFPDLEALLAGAEGCAGTSGTLYVQGSGFLLAVPVGGTGPGLYEFGTPVALSPDWELHARDQERCILAENALGQLHRLFSTGDRNC